MDKKLESAFQETSRIVLGTRLTNLLGYEDWLSSRVPLPHLAKSAHSQKPVWLPPNTNFLRTDFNSARIIDAEEVEAVSGSPFNPSDLQKCGLKEMRQRIVRSIAFFCGNYRYGKFEQVERVSGCGDCMNIYYSDDIYHKVRNVAYSNYILHSESMFGCRGVMYSKFCMHAYNSSKVVRAFEIDGCTSSSNIFFCHNCEGLSNCMFCFNAKSLRYAIGNTEVGQEQYMRIKKVVLDEIVGKLEKDKNLELDIYNIGCYKK
ncbi:MAG: hypothetical protein PHS02_04365 [Candidatus ainarchaeum sp.]|nr:hypothetical protein [Candidatus ainarchaeum sp.]